MYHIYTEVETTTVVLVMVGIGKEFSNGIESSLGCLTISSLHPVRYCLFILGNLIVRIHDCVSKSRPTWRWVRGPELLFGRDGMPVV